MSEPPMAAGSYAWREPRREPEIPDCERCGGSQESFGEFRKHDPEDCVEHLAERVRSLEKRMALILDPKT